MSLTAATQSKTIDGAEYVVRHLPPLQSLQILARVTGMAAAGFSSMKQLRDVASVFVMGVGNVLMRMDDESVAVLVNALKDVTTVRENGRSVPLASVFDLHFEGRLPALLTWLKFAAEVTYGPLVPMLQRELAKQGTEEPPAAA